MIRLLAFVVAIRCAIALANAPIEEWTCGDCGATQGTGRARCMNGCGTDGPLAPERED